MKQPEQFQISHINDKQMPQVTQRIYSEQPADQIDIYNVEDDKPNYFFTLNEINEIKDY